MHPRTSVTLIHGLRLVLQLSPIQANRAELQYRTHHLNKVGVIFGKQAIFFLISLKLYILLHNVKETVVLADLGLTTWVTVTGTLFAHSTFYYSLWMEN